MENKEVKIDEVSINDGSNTDSPATEPNTATDNTDQQIETLNKQIEELNDKYLRTAAELENTRRRATLDAQSLAMRRAMSVAEKVLPVMDAIQAALQHNPDDAGIKSMAMAMESAFAQIGIVKIDSIGQILNPQFHNAIQVTDAPCDKDKKRPAPNTIVSEIQPGYMFGDTVLRTAMVIVCK